MQQQAKGRFDIRRTPQDPCDLGDGAQAMHARFDKTFHGGLTATSVAHMLAVMGAVEGSAAYVAIERISGTLDGRRGSFLVQHSGTMDRGAPSLTVMVVPDSGAEELVGLSGHIGIDIDPDGTHHYTFDYALAAA